MCRSMNRLWILASMHFYPNYLITMTAHITVYGIYPWVNVLVMGNLMGRRFWVGCGWFVLDRHMWCSSFDTLTTSSTHWRQWRGCCTSFRHGLRGAVGIVSCVHVVYVTCYFCCMFSLGPSSGCIDRCYERQILVGFFVYYETIKRDLNERLIYECRKR